jgi:hypothetical protein
LHDGVIVLLHDDAMADVKLHDIVDVAGILDPFRHEDDDGEESNFDDLDNAFAQEIADENVDGNGTATSHCKVAAPSAIDHVSTHMF